MSLNNQEWEKLRAMINAWPDDSDRILMHRVINREHEGPCLSRAKQALDLGRRQTLLARMAGNIASGLCKDIPPDELRGAKWIAQTAVEIAEQILERIGL